MTWEELVSGIRRVFRRDAVTGGATVHVARDGGAVEPLAGRGVAVPAVDVFENSEELLVRADVPGGTSARTRVSWDDGRGLSFLVERSDALAGAPWFSEYDPRDWHCIVPLAGPLDGARASATLQHGVLEVRIPKRTSTTRLLPVTPG